MIDIFGLKKGVALKKNTFKEDVTGVFVYYNITCPYPFGLHTSPPGVQLQKGYGVKPLSEKDGFVEDQNNLFQSYYFRQ